MGNVGLQTLGVIRTATCMVFLVFLSFFPTSQKIAALKKKKMHYINKVTELKKRKQLPCCP